MTATLHVVAGLDPRDGGPAYSVPRLCKALREFGAKAQILTTHAERTVDEQWVRSYRHDAASLPLLGSLRLSSGLARAARSEAETADLVHSHGLWLMPNIYAGQTAAKAGKSLVVSPRGMLAPAALQFSRRKKRLFWSLLQGPAYDRAALWHATAEQEAEEIRAFGIKAPIAVVPNGIDMPEGIAGHTNEKSRRTLLFLSRIHPKKGLVRLLAAWALTEQDRPNWDLVIAGDSEGDHRNELEAQVAALGLKHVRFTGPVYGKAKTTLLESADLFVLPTLNENFGIAVAEALATGVPVIVTKGAPWSGLEAEGCGWWIDHGVEELASTLAEATALPPSERRAMGQRGRDWMARAYGWDAIARDMHAAYAWLCGTGDRPDCVVMR